MNIFMTLGQKDTAILTKMGQNVILWQTVQMFRLECPDFLGGMRSGQLESECHSRRLIWVLM